MSIKRSLVVKTNTPENATAFKIPEPAKGSCKCMIAKLITCVGQQHTALLMAVNSIRVPHAMKLCAKEGQKQNKKQYYDQKLEDYKKKIKSANRGNQLKMECKGGGGCGGDSNPGMGVEEKIEQVKLKQVEVPTFPLMSIPFPENMSDDEIISVIEKIKKDFSDTGNPNNPLGGDGSKLPLEEITDLETLKMYVLQFKEYVEEHPLYRKIMADEFPRSCHIFDTPFVFERCKQYIRLDEKGEPLLDGNGDFVFIDRDRFFRCMQSFLERKSEAIDGCEDCNQYLDEFGNPIEPDYSICVSFYCNKQNLIRKLCEGCEDFVDRYGDCVAIETPYSVNVTGGTIYNDTGDSFAVTEGVITFSVQECCHESVLKIDGENSYVVTDMGRFDFQDSDGAKGLADSAVAIGLEIVDRGNDTFLKIQNPIITKVFQNIILTNSDGYEIAKAIQTFDIHIQVADDLVPVKPKMYEKTGDIIKIQQLVGDKLEEMFVYAYDICAKVRCGNGLNTPFIDEDCMNMEGANDLIKAPWLEDKNDLSDEFKKVRRYEVCMYNKILDKLKEVKTDCNDCKDSIFLDSEAIEVAKEKGFFSDEYLRIIADRLRDVDYLSSKYNLSRELLSSVGFGSKAFINLISYIHGLRDAVTVSEYEFGSIKYLKDAIRNNISKCILENVYEDKPLKDECYEEAMKQIAKNVWNSVYTQNETKFVNPEMCNPLSITLDLIQSVMAMGVEPVFINKKLGDKYVTEYRYGDVVIRKFVEVEADREKIREIAYKNNRLDLLDADNIYSLKVDVIQNEVKVQSLELLNTPCKVYEDCKSIILGEKEVEEIEKEFVPEFKEKDIAKIEQILDMYPDVIDDIIKCDDKLVEHCKKMGYSDNIEDCVKFKILSSAEIMDILEYLAEEQQKFCSPILEYLSNKKSLVEFLPDKVMVEGEVSQKQVEVLQTPEKVVKRKESYTEISIEKVSVIVRDGVLLPKVKPSMQIIEEHLKHLEMLDKFNSEEYLQSLKLRIVLPVSKIYEEVPIEDESFKARIIDIISKKIKEIPIDTFSFEDLEIGGGKIPVEVDVELVEADDIEGSDGHILLAVNIDSVSMAKLQEEIERLKSLEVDVSDLERFFNMLVEINNMKIIEVPIDVFIYGGEDRITIDLKE